MLMYFSADAEDITSTWTSPKRLFAPLNDSPISVCDYVFQDETTQVQIYRDVNQPDSQS